MTLGCGAMSPARRWTSRWHSAALTSIRVSPAGVGGPARTAKGFLTTSEGCIPSRPGNVVVHGTTYSDHPGCWHPITIRRVEQAGGSAEQESDDRVGRFTPQGDEVGTAPGDRRWRPDVEGLRAVAVVVVVAYHYGIPGFSGGYVGVDVFFVISGFVITGLLVPEHESTGRTSLVDFYARRFRRILPAATLVILSTVLATYVFAGSVFGANAARNGIWAAAFIYNFRHFVSDWNFLPSLGNYWSLAVEEQFYFVYPALFLMAVGGRVEVRRGSGSWWHSR